MERHHIDVLLGQIRKKVVRGSKHTRHGRLRGALRILPVKHPTKPREYGRSALGEELNTMSLHDAIQRFRGISEANTPAPAPKASNPDGKQLASKSDFDDNVKGHETYTGEKAKIPADAEAKAAAKNSTAGVKGPVGPDGREKVDIRHEQVADALVKEDASLASLISMCYEMAETSNEFTGLVEKFVGFENLKKKIAAKGGAVDPGAVAAKIGMKKYGKKKFEKAAHAGKSLKGAKPKGEQYDPIDTFKSTPKQDSEDLQFAAAMLADKVGDLRRRPVNEANIPAPAPGNSGPDGKAQTASKSSFDDKIKPDKDYKGDSVSIPSDAEAKAAAKNATAGVSGPGYDASGRERVDVRTEQESRILPGEDADQAFVRMHGLA